MKRYAMLILALVFIACGCSYQKSSDVDLLITNASIVDVQADSLLKKKIIGVSGDRIVAVDEVANRNQYKSKEIVDAEGQYIMPGLWDMHVHFLGGDTLAAENKKLLPLFLAFGITTARLFHQ